MKATFQRVMGRFIAMSTECSIVVYVRCTKHGEFVIGEAINEVRRIEKKYSRFDQNSVISRINRDSWKIPVPVDTETALLLDFSAVCYDQTVGAFDITCGNLHQLWRGDRTDIPSDDEIQEALQHVGWKKVRWDGRLISLPTDRMSIDLGGVGKEYAADRALAILKEHGIQFSMVNFGGDIAVHGGKPDGSGWKIGIKDGSGFESRSVSVVRVADQVIEAWQGGIATSGTAERFIEIGGVRFSHLIDALSGRPLIGDFAYTVTHSSCLAAGALATQQLLVLSGNPSAGCSMASAVANFPE
jgi:thiamine biosynthesis lipoprotein